MSKLKLHWKRTYCRGMIIGTLVQKYFTYISSFFLSLFFFDSGPLNKSPNNSIQVLCLLLLKSLMSINFLYPDIHCYNHGQWMWASCFPLPALTVFRERPYSSADWTLQVGEGGPAYLDFWSRCEMNLFQTLFMILDEIWNGTNLVKTWFSDKSQTKHHVLKSKNLVVWKTKVFSLKMLC